MFTDVMRLFPRCYSHDQTSRSEVPRLNFTLWAGGLLGLLLFCLLPLPVGAVSLTPLLQFSAIRQPVGIPLRVTAYFHNQGLAPQRLKLPESLTLRLQSDQGTVSYLTAVADSEGQLSIIKPGAFLTKAYQLKVPLEYTGLTEVMIADQPESAVLLSFYSAETDSAEELVASLPEAENSPYPTLESLFSLYQHYGANFSPYKPMYFLIGANPEDSKFQISFKYSPFNPAGFLSSRYSWLQGVYFAFTQTSFWALDSDSAPFQDTSYKPELFFLSDNLNLRPTWLQGFFIQSGVQHESNGRGGDLSRSTNTFYVQPSFIFYAADTELGLQVSPRLSGYFNNDDKTNPDLSDYRGNLELDLKFGKAKGLVVGTTFRFAERGVSMLADLTYPVSKLLGNNFDIYFQLQYADALAESLLDYTKRNRAIRFGISIVR